MNDVARLVLEAWEKLGPKIMADPQELARRLARRRMAILTRPVRAWCIAVRASDRRITPAHWVIFPEHAMDLNHPLHPYEPIEHEVTIQTHALRRYCRPVRTDSWGEEVADVCKQLGVSRASLLRARWAGLYSERFIKGLGGKHCRHPIPLIHSWTTLDPSGPAFNQRPDQLWGSLWEWLPDMIPDNFEQTLIRRPHYSPFPTNGAPKGHRDLRFRGWRWLCPSCKKPTRIVFYPLPPTTLFDFLGRDPGGADIPVRHPQKKSLPYDLHQLDPPPPTFACKQCHRITSFTRTDNRGWNLVVSHLTRGLLFGHEVPKPDWYKPQRKRARHRKLTPPGPRRMAVLDLLLAGRTDRQIARELSMSMHRVQANITHLCRQENVPDRLDLARKLGSPHPQPLNQIKTALRRRQIIEPLLLQDLTYSQISAQTGIDRWLVYHDAQAIYRKHGLPPGSCRQAFLKKVNITHPPRFARDMPAMHQLKSRILAGQSNSQIAYEMRLTYNAVAQRFFKLCKVEGVRGRKGLFEKYASIEKSQPAASTV